MATESIIYDPEEKIRENQKCLNDCCEKSESIDCVKNNYTLFHNLTEFEKNNKSSKQNILYPFLESLLDKFFDFLKEW
jgi:hypothetical protein